MSAKLAVAAVMVSFRVGKVSETSEESCFPSLAAYHSQLPVHLQVQSVGENSCNGDYACDSHAGKVTVV